MYAVNWVKGLFAAVLLLGCGRGPNSGPAVRNLTDDLGRSVEVPSRPSRVVSLAPGLTEIVFAAGGGDRLVAVTTADDYPPEVAAIPKIGAYPLNREAVVGQDPDLVLATDQVNSTHEVAPISELGIPTYFLQFESFGEIVAAIRTVGDLLNTETHADSTADALASRWARLEAASSEIQTKPRVLLLVGSDVLYAFGAESYTNEMIVVAGGDPVTGSLPGQSAVLNDEFVLANPPDIILGPRGTSAGPGFDRETLLSNHPSWDALPAIRSGRVYTLDPDLIFRPGPRVVKAAEQTAEIIEAFLVGREP